ncbi:MAG: Druantia anti-phage system protein DruA [Pseudomonadota bacterium]
MDEIIFRYRARQLGIQDIRFIQALISKHFQQGRSHISRALCEVWQWVQPNGKLKEYAARDLLLRLEEQGLIELPPRLRPKNNLKEKSFDQVPLFLHEPIHGSAGEHDRPCIEVVHSQGSYLWDYLVHHHHYLGLPKLVGEHLRYLVSINGQVVACLSWASAAWKVKARDQFIGWDDATKQRNLHLIVNNTRFLIPDWVRVKHLASRVLALSLRRLSADWQKIYGHPIHLAETFVDISRFEGTCYRAANWVCVGQTKGSAKKGNAYLYHGQPKAIYLYPLHRHFRRYLLDDQG